ncbi:MAG: class I SAM-dependent methyltransferase, partial [Pseudomonadota bacterium]
MPIEDRIVLYALIRGLKPKSYLEIGVRWGGSARIVAAAMEANGSGEGVGLDPDLSAFRPRRKDLHGRYRTLQGCSPDDTAKAAALLGRSVDFAFIDAVHTYSAVKADAGGLLPYCSPGGYVLFHDAFHQGINRAVDEFLEKNHDFIDLGILSKNPEVGLPVSYGGLRLIKRGTATEYSADLASAHARAGMAEPKLEEAVWDYDPYANRIGNPLGRPDKTDSASSLRPLSHTGSFHSVRHLSGLSTMLQSVGDVAPCPCSVPRARSVPLLERATVGEGVRVRAWTAAPCSPLSSLGSSVQSNPSVSPQQCLLLPTAHSLAQRTLTPETI